jgi:hypothetical protein
LTEKRGNRSTSEEKRIRHAQNQNYYRRKKEEYEQKRIQLDADVAAGVMSREEADKTLGQIQLGWFRYRNKVKELQDQLAAATSANTSGNTDEIDSLRSQLEETIVKTGQSMDIFSRTCDDLTALFRDTSSPNDGLPVIPTTPSRHNFLEFLAHFLPMPMWNDDPMHNQSINIVRTILSSDKQFSRHNNISHWFSEAEKLTILQTFNEAVNEAKEYWSIASKSERKEFSSQWIAVREAMQRSFFPIHNISCAVFHKILEAAYNLENLESGDDESNMDIDE